MGSIRTTIATMLAALALAASAPDADAQARRSSDVNNSRRSSQATKSDDNRKSSVSRPSTTVTTPSKKGATPSIIPGIKLVGNDKDDSKPGLKPDSDKPVQITRPAPRKPQGNSQADRPGVRPDARPDRPDVNPGKPAVKPDRPDVNPGKPAVKPDKPDVKPGKPNVKPDKPGKGYGYNPEPPRVHPRDRDFMRWDKPSYWWSYDDHYYGHKVRMLPSRARKHVYHGVTYYCYNDIWYRPYGGHYVVCRPPYGLSVAAEIISDLAWAAVRVSYYSAMANAYSQNAYALANRLNLRQNYASADSDYFYQDGVFYAKDARGEYRIILPPAGALVEDLPDDFDLITLSDGNEYYKVDDTIYKLTIVDGKPYFEVAGQMYD